MTEHDEGDGIPTVLHEIIRAHIHGQAMAQQILNIARDGGDETMLRLSKLYELADNMLLNADGIDTTTEKGTQETWVVVMIAASIVETAMQVIAQVAGTPARVTADCILQIAMLGNDPITGQTKQATSTH